MPLRNYQEKAFDLVKGAVETDVSKDYAVTKTGIVLRITTGPGTYPGRILNPWVESHGYVKVTIGRLHYFVHRLVLIAFRGKPSNGKVANHKDGNKQNNNILNLEWVTPSENTLHAYRNGLKLGMCGEKHPMSKLSASDVDDIKNSLKNNKRGLSAALAKEYGVSKYAISDIKRGKSWI